MASHLGSYVVQPHTSQRYHTHVHHFHEWCRSRHIRFRYTVHHADLIDRTLSRYINYLAAHHYPLTHARYALIGLLFVAPQLRGHLSRSAQALHGWTLHTPSHHH